MLICFHAQRFATKSPTTLSVASGLQAWPSVESFVRELPPGSVIGDVGCGNGKNMRACNQVGIGIASDVSVELCKICGANGHEVAAADALNLPYRTGVFDGVICIAVPHQTTC